MPKSIKKPQNQIKITLKSKSHAAHSGTQQSGSDIRWVIIGKHGLYTGQWITRNNAIMEHVKALFIIPSDKFLTHIDAWKYCRRKGDRVVKALVSWSNKKRRH